MIWQAAHAIDEKTTPKRKTPRYASAFLLNFILSVQLTNPATALMEMCS
jgi:hypothetical protein